MAEQSLKDKTVKGVGWSAIDNLSRYVVTFVVGIILARLLSPDDYGLIGIITIFTVVCNALIDGGLSSALIRKKVTTENDYNTVFLINFALSIVLYIVVFAFSPSIARFFGRQELISLTRVTSLSIVIGALTMVQQVLLIKRIDFKTQTKITLISSVCSGMVGITMALFHFGVWALVAQNLSQRIVSTILFGLYNKWLPNFLFSSESFKELFGYGWKMMLVAVLNSIWTELYQVIIGKFYSPASLGQYTRAKQFSDLLSSNLSTVVQRVTFPVLSSIQDEKERMLVAYRRIIKTTMFIAAISSFALGAVSEPLLYCLIGPKWHQAAVYLPFICVAGSLYPLHAINLNMLQVQGRSDLFLGIEIVKKVIALLPLYIGATVGIIPMLGASIVMSVICFFLNSFFTGKLLGYSSWMQIKDVLPSYCVASIVALSVWFLKYLPISNWIILPIQLVLGGGVFFFICSMFKIDEYYEVIKIIKPLVQKISKEKPL